MLVFPTVDGKVVAGPTAVDHDDGRLVRSPRGARRDPAEGGRRCTRRSRAPSRSLAYAGLRPAGRGVNYLIAGSRTEPALVNVAAIRSTGLTASLAIAERVVTLVAAAGVPVAEPEPLAPGPPPAPEGEPWWRRTMDRLAV